MNLSQITTQFTGLMNRRDLTANTSLVTNFLNAAQVRVNRDLRCPANEKWVNVTIATGYTGLVIPNDYLELIGIYPNADWTVRCKMDKLERVLNYAKFATDKSLLYARQGGQWILGPAPSVGDVITLGYYAEVPALVNSTDTNIVSIIAWDLLVYAALAYAAEYYNDKRQPAFEARYNQILADLNDMGQDDELNEGHMEPVHYFPDDDTDNFEIWVP